MPDDGYRTIDANGLRFAYLEAGGGPLVLCLHGFPDTPHTFESLLAHLASSGYHAVAPFSRGIYPTTTPENEDYSPLELGRDALALIEAFGQTSGAIVGHDWGAQEAYAAANLNPARVSKMVTVAIPHSRAIQASFKLMRRGWHFGVFQLPFVPERMARRNDFALVEQLWRAWSPHLHPDPRLLNYVKASYSHPSSLKAALGYYRAMPSALGGMTKRRRQEREILYRKTSVPTLCVWGSEDGVFDASVFARTTEAFTGPYKLVEMKGTGHFLHQECSREFDEIVTEFLASPVH